MTILGSLVLNEIPNGSDGKPEDVNIADLIAGKKVAIFGVPGAFTPGCSKSHLPSFMEAQSDLIMRDNEVRMRDKEVRERR